MKHAKRIAKTTGISASLLVVVMFVGGCAHKLAVMGNEDRAYGSIAFSPDSRQLAAAERRGSGVVIFEVATRVESGRFAPSKAAKAGVPATVSYNPEGSAVAVYVGKDNLTVWNTSTSNLLARIPSSPPPDKVVLSPAGRYLALSWPRQPVSVWEVNSGRKLLELTNGSAKVVTMAFAPDEQRLAIADTEHKIRLWRLPAGNLLTTLPPQRSAVNAMALANTNDLLAVSAGAVDVWRWQTTNRVQTLPSASLGAGARAVGIGWMLFSTWGLHPSVSLEVFRPDPAGAVAFSPDGKYLAMINSAANVTTAIMAKQEQVRVLEVATGKELCSVAYGERIGSVAFSPDGHWLATAGLWGVDVWDWTKTKGKHAASVGSTPFAPVVIQLPTHFPANPAVPVIRLPGASVRVATFLDARPQSQLGKRTAALDVEMGDILPARPVAETLREAVAGIFAGSAAPAADDPGTVEIAGTVRKFSVRTPASLVSWRIEANIELELRATNAPSRAVHSAVYKGQAHRVTYLWPSENLIEKTCADALRQLLQNIQSDPAWARWKPVNSGKPREAR